MHLSPPFFDDIESMTAQFMKVDSKGYEASKNKVCISHPYTLPFLTLG